MGVIDELAFAVPEREAPGKRPLRLQERSRRAEPVQLLVERVQATGRTVEPESIEWTPPARPFFKETALLKRPRTDSNRRRKRTHLDGTPAQLE
jgi:hypothetical protein